MFSLGWVPPMRKISRKHLKALISEKMMAKNTEYHICGVVI